MQNLLTEKQETMNGDRKESEPSPNLAFDSKQAETFLDILFKNVFDSDIGDVEIRTFQTGGSPSQTFHNNIESILQEATDLCHRNINIHIGVNPRIGKKGGKENVKYLTCFHTDIDYGKTGHKKPPTHQTYNKALSAIQSFNIEPSLIIHSGNGFHVYWILKEPISVEEYGIDTLQSINRALCQQLGGDSGTHDISRILRLPGTFNFKSKDTPRPVSIISHSDQTYNYDDFKDLFKNLPDNEKPNKQSKTLESTSLENSSDDSFKDLFINRLSVSEKIKDLIRHGNNGAYRSRSEADMAVVAALLQSGESEEDIRNIFSSFPIGEKYREHPSPDNYLNHNIQNARKLPDLLPEDLENPFFLKGAIQKEGNTYKLNIVKFQESMVQENHIIYQEQESSFFRYNGKCYEEMSMDALNNKCQKALGTQRELFTKEALSQFRHYAIGDKGTWINPSNQEFIRYLTLENGLYDLEQKRLVSHTPNIFTTNLLPYKYAPTKECPKFIKFLNEIFLEDQDVIAFVQQAMGYCFHKSIPTPALFLLIGEGSNGKSVFLDVLRSLVGENNCCSVNLKQLGHEYYLLFLRGKMVNISSETPTGNLMSMDIVKAVVAGDQVAGRQTYGMPQTFKPYCKHFFAMNEAPQIDDQTYGMWRRIYVIEFPRVFTDKDMDVHLTEKLLTELPGIFNFAMDGYRQLESNQFQFPKSQSMQKAKTKVRTDTNSVLQFASRYFKQGASVRLNQVYENYKLFCKNEGIKNPKGKIKFRETLQAFGYEIENSTQDGNQLYLLNVKSVFIP